MAFESLADKFQAVFKKMRGQDKLTEENMDSPSGRSESPSSKPT
jgi:signal recognition particle GTPase